MWPQIVLCFLLTFILDGVCFSFHQHSSTLSTPDRRESRKRRDSSSSLKDHTNGSSYSEQSLSNEEISRYSRHLVLSVSLSTFIVFSVVITELLGWKQETFSPSYLIVTEKDVGMAGQKVLKNASVLVVGAGGLGSPCLLYLAAAGVGHIGIVDADTVDTSNLQRQVIHSMSTVGISKCESARRRIHDINPHVNVRLYEEEFTSETAQRILIGGFFEGRPYDVVVDGSDNFPTKYLINDVCELAGTPWVYSAILAFEGQLSVFNFQGGPNYRDMLPNPPPPGDVPSCAEGGVLGVLPGTMGCLQATEVIKILLKHKAEEITSGRVLIFDALKMKFGDVGLVKQENRKIITELIDYQGFCAGPKTKSKPKTNLLHHTAKTQIVGRTMDEAETFEPENQEAFESIEPTECLEKLTGGWTPWVLDVRLKTENDIVALPFTDIIVPHRVVRRENVPESGDVLVYCKAGVRGKKACQRLIEQGIEPDRLYNLEGGIMKWQKEVDPSMPRY